MRVRLLYYFTRRVAVTNLFVSLLATSAVQAVGFMYSGRPPRLSAILPQFAGIGLTAGFALATYIYHLFRRHEMPMYHNYGLRLPACTAFAFAAHLLVLMPISFVGWAIGGGPPP